MTVYMLKTVCPEFGFIVKPGDVLKAYEEYEAKANLLGAIAAKCPTGEYIGVKPGEFILIDPPAEVERIWKKENPLALEETVLEYARSKGMREPGMAYWEWYEHTVSTTEAYEYEYGWRCSHCEGEPCPDWDDPGVSPAFKYCPCCGAKMDLEISENIAQGYREHWEKETAENKREK